jgi:hypothetical protein
MSNVPGLGSDTPAGGLPPIDPDNQKPNPDPDIRSVPIRADVAMAWKVFLYGVFSEFHATDFDLMNSPMEPTLQVIGKFGSMVDWINENYTEYPEPTPPS